MTDRRVALITGGATGIGEATVRRFAIEGFRVAIVAHSSMNEMQALRTELADRGAEVEAFRCDVGDPDEINVLLARVIERFGGVDVIVNNAGVWNRTPIFEEHREAVIKQMNVNFLGAYLIIQGLLNQMRDRGGGSIVNVASLNGVLGQVKAAAYSASKAALVMLTKTLAPEMKGTGIRINCVAPGATATKINAMVHTPQTPAMEAMKQRISGFIPSPYGEPFLKPEAIADVIYFLCSPEAAGVQGECIRIDQGLGAAMTEFD